MNEITILFKIRLKNLKGKRRNYIFNDFNYESSIFQFNFKNQCIIEFFLFVLLFISFLFFMFY